MHQVDTLTTEPQKDSGELHQKIVWEKFKILKFPQTSVPICNRLCKQEYHFRKKQIVLISLNIQIQPSIKAALK